MSARRGAAFGAAMLAVSMAQAAPYTYSNYASMVSDLEGMATQYPGLTDLTTAQDAYGLSLDGIGQYAQYILRITNEATGLDKPEVLIVGVQHGDEVVSLEVALETARLLLESYGTDPWLTALVDRREIYIMPMANPQGFADSRRGSPGTEGNSEDMNRDHIYDRDDCSFLCGDEDSLSTIGGRAIHELARRHLFRVMVDLHGGAEVILHSWGSPLHIPNTESPDDRAAADLGERMRTYGGPYRGFSPVGTASDLLGPVHGPLDDTAYAASWDAANADPLYPTDGWRALAYTIEISSAKRPAQSTLGGDADLLTPGGTEDGYVPKNVRVALAAIDIAEPWIEWLNRDEIPAQVAPGETIDVQWQVRGCFDIDDTRVRWGFDPDPRVNFTDQTASQSDSGDSACFDTPTVFSASVSFPTMGGYFLAPVARVDSALLQQGNPNPAVAPQSWIVRGRTEEGLLGENAFDPGEPNSVVGQLYWGAPPLPIEVIDVADTDGDGVGDSLDNCVTFANADQRDTDGDGLGNACDGDLNQDCQVNFGDLGLFKAAFFPNPYDENADLTGDGFVSFSDLARLKETFFNQATPGPGPSGLPDLCD